MIDERLIEAVGIMVVLIACCLFIGIIWARNEQRRQ